MQSEQDHLRARLVYAALVALAVLSGVGVLGGVALIAALMLAGPSSELGRALPFWPAFTTSFGSFIVLVWVGMLLALWDVRLR